MCTPRQAGDEGVFAYAAASGFAGFCLRDRINANTPTKIMPPPEAKLLRSQLGPEQGITWVSTPSTNADPARVQPAPPTHQGVVFRPADPSRKQPATNITGPARSHVMPQAAYANRIECHSRITAYPALETRSPKKIMNNAARIARQAIFIGASLLGNLHRYLPYRNSISSRQSYPHI